MNAKVGVIMGSTSDWDTMKHACDILEELQVPYEKKVVSAHRTPELMFEYAESARERGLNVIIAGAGGAAHLPGMVAAKTTLPVIGVPVQSRTLNGLDSLLSIVQMPGGVPVATVAIGKAGAKNAGLLAAQILSLADKTIEQKLSDYRNQMKETVLESSDSL
ncbi:5-(carboxyamino)imidazole ribonucleotide mutase [Bacillus sp. es.036]|uniref:5-(carboxyamino)imidazole ribonucleotide mutase n=1 Tax=Bacillus sp. es.036 TaxID=1761764 RepID=UPI000BFA943A|nr:5-(carboxyamino)imidazole ribonucleotide mutase [Bacillus sp. es.036]PFG02828.1 5-(carboxyamino)imidazole ribonucleotide mutase [Bacillus sp. es.036]